MIQLSAFRKKALAVFGLGKSGRMSARALRDAGAAVSAWDDSEKSRDAAAAEGVVLTNLHHADWSGFDGLVLAPGVPLTHPEPHWTVLKAKEAGVPVISDIELYLKQRETEPDAAPFIAITGTNGKSTTTALVAHLLNRAGRPADAGGNIGIPVLELPPLAEKRHAVIECSSYQIDITPSLSPDTGVLLNISPDHLDRHGTMENYADVKSRLVKSCRHAVIGTDDAYCRDIAAAVAASGVPVTTVSADPDRLPDILFGNGELHLRDKNIYRKLINLNDVYTLRGDHNLQNAAAAAAVMLALGLSEKEFLNGFSSFPGLSHRMELVARLGRVLFINDSKATNADAAGKALGSFDPVYWIAGGRAKSDGIDPLSPFFPRIRKAFLIGEAQERFSETLDGLVDCIRCDTLDRAVEAAAAEAVRDGADEPAVVFSPACASFDQFPDFEVRGDTFRTCVSEIKNIEMISEA